MRPDLNKLLCERERRGGYRNHHEYRRKREFQPDLDPENGGGLHREGMTRRYGYDGKDFNENLQPLLGAVRKAVGRPYAKFYSELSEVFDKRSVINQHILLHLKQYLETDLYVGADGELLFRGKYGSPDRRLAGSDVEFYVDPRDGIIKRNRRRITHRQRMRKRVAEERAEQDAVYRALPDGSELYLINGVWFHCTLADAPVGRTVYEKPAGQELFKHSWEKVGRSWEKLSAGERHRFGAKRFIGDAAFDVLTHKRVFTEEGTSPVRYCVSKRTASHKLLKQVGLVGP